MKVQKELLQKIAQLSKCASEIIGELEDKVAILHKDSVAKDLLEDSLQEGAEKIGKALYEADFITDKYKYNDFVKRASKDPMFLAKAVERICLSKSADSLGSVSSVTIKQAEAMNDPIYARAFGYSNNFEKMIDD